MPCGGSVLEGPLVAMIEGVYSVQSVFGMRVVVYVFEGIAVLEVPTVVLQPLLLYSDERSYLV